MRIGIAALRGSPRILPVTPLPSSTGILRSRRHPRRLGGDPLQCPVLRLLHGVARVAEHLGERLCRKS